jgi:uncharacterized protein YndB with AHSA1/START domain
MSTNKDDGGGEFTVSGVVDARRELVWQAFTEPEHLAAFWADPGLPCRSSPSPWMSVQGAASS